MQPCAQEPTIVRIEGKVERILDTLTALAVQGEQIKTLRADVNELYERVRGVEEAPTKRLEKAAWLLVGGLGSLVLLVISKLV